MRGEKWAMNNLIVNGEDFRVFIVIVIFMSFIYFLKSFPFFLSG